MKVFITLCLYITTFASVMTKEIADTNTDEYINKIAIENGVSYVQVKFVSAFDKVLLNGPENF